ncbi:MAG: (d)CMP kinase [Prevotella sp.]|nr:(d)CMP kinase [Prevotella sp.]MCM1474763.1 (d)CMP kinase [Muribaculaceae bacterium]
MARELASAIGYLYVDSGAMYRAVTLYAIRNGMIADDGFIDEKALTKALPNVDISFKICPDGKQHTLLNGEDVEKDIRGMQVSTLVSPVSAIKEVRKHLTALQQKYGKAKGIVMDGRDIGTTVFPKAEMKVFVNASPEVRAKRRVLELEEKGQKVSYKEVLANIKERDYIDTHRKESPLIKAHDAFELNNDNISRQEQLHILLDFFHMKIHG